METAEYNNLTIIRRTKGGIPILPFVLIKEAILGAEYELSLVFPTQDESIDLHKTWKKKNGPVNTLAFPLDDEFGEIIITLSQARKEAPKYGRNYSDHLVFLFIHSCLHLKGMTHGAKMEKQERFFYKQFSKN
jgi:probable rRNA maturation factor